MQCFVAIKLTQLQPQPPPPPLVRAALCRNKPPPHHHHDHRHQTSSSVPLHTYSRNSRCHTAKCPFPNHAKRSGTTSAPSTNPIDRTDNVCALHPMYPTRRRERERSRYGEGGSEGDKERVLHPPALGLVIGVRRSHRRRVDQHREHNVARRSVCQADLHLCTLPDHRLPLHLLEGDRVLLLE